MRSTEKQPDQDRLHHGDLRPHPRPLHPGHEVRESQGGAVWCSGHTGQRGAEQYWEIDKE